MRRYAVIVTVVASTVLDAQEKPTTRSVGATTATSAAGVLRSVSAVRPLPGGSVVVNDIVGRRLLLLDGSLTLRRVLADSSSQGGGTYASRAVGLLAMGPDTTVMIDPATLAMVLFSPQGDVTRVMAIPRPADAPFMVGGPFGAPGFDAAGRLFYRGAFRPAFPSGPPEPGVIEIPQPDSVPVLRLTFETRRVDTMTFVRIPRTTSRIAVDDRGINISTVTNPLATVDDWVVDTRGALMVVRGGDYHVERIDQEGRVTRGPRIPFEWERLSDERKAAIVDSVARLLATQRATQVEAARAAGNRNAIGPSVEVVAASALPDYRPAFRQGAARVDEDGRVWILTTRSSAGGAVYDVVGPNLVIEERVRLPFGRTVVGFGNGLVYLAVEDGNGARLEAARVR